VAGYAKSEWQVRTFQMTWARSGYAGKLSNEKG
jgi:hypothetical protein